MLRPVVCQEADGGDGLENAMGATIEGLVSGSEEAGNEAPPSPPPPRSAPKAWPAEMHEHYSKLDPKLQDLIDLREKQAADGVGQYKSAAEWAAQMQAVIKPYLPDIEVLGAKPEQAVRALLHANRILQNGTPEQKRAMFSRLARDYGIDIAQLTAGVAPDPNAAPVDPALKEIVSRLDRVEGGLNAGQQARFEALQAESEKEVEVFAADPANVYFEEVGEDIALLLQADKKLSLKDAYEKAVWANPVTRAKETERLQKETVEKARLESLKKAEEAKKARGTTVKGKETGRSPQGDIGSIEDTLKATLKEINARE